MSVAHGRRCSRRWFGWTRLDSGSDPRRLSGKRDGVESGRHPFTSYSACRFSRDLPRFRDSDEVVRYLARDFWVSVFGRPAESVRVDKKVQVAVHVRLCAQQSADRACFASPTPGSTYSRTSVKAHSTRAKPARWTTSVADRAASHYCAVLEFALRACQRRARALWRDGRGDGRVGNAASMCVGGVWGTEKDVLMCATRRPVSHHRDGLSRAMKHELDVHSCTFGPVTCTH
jgi:hypothetical protein